MAHGDVTSRDNRGQWENSVEGMPERSASYSSRDEAVEAGAALATELGSSHVVEEAEPSGVITDEQEDDDAR
ncbi:DUF2188 domain-containing protein [Labedella populi]|uniref:DUF2188 domain-containing protein n=1 Tax=Labedella populi TaxID=2498850 RepID=A0A3S4C2P5_9MICO|nr:DUF2188 domain-containing protein [Labedella populi]RWZ61548.1 DUF2188 domain-containing protein [Labedella populi]